MTVHARNYHAGLAAEDSTLRHYAQAGYALLARRWRGIQGEIDLILQRGADVVFVEVKKSRSFDHAVARLGGAQMARIWQTAEQFLGTQPLGLNTPARVDVALVNSMGQVQVIENAMMA
jgi:putative endonuclease